MAELSMFTSTYLICTAVECPTRPCNRRSYLARLMAGVSFSKIDIISAWEALPDKGGTLDKFSGRWRIKWMETWDQDFVDLIEPGYFLFDEDGLGFFMFGAVEGQLDYRITDDEARVDFSWSGNDDGDEKSGRGWFELSSSNTAKGQFFIHCGDESAVEIEKQA